MTLPLAVMRAAAFMLAGGKWEGRPGGIRIGPAGSTRKMCPEAEMAVEQRFLEQLAGVAQIRCVADRLALPFAKKGNVSGTMLFDRRAAK